MSSVLYDPVIKFLCEREPKSNKHDILIAIQFAI